MKKRILLVVAIVALQACSGTRNVNDKWIGESKKNLIKSWGSPVRIIKNNDEEEILVYAEQVYKNTDNNNKDAGMAGSSYWNYTYVYTNKEGRIYSCKTDRQQRTPQEIVVK